MKAILPFVIRCAPITKLALINFEKASDPIYAGLELQYIEGEEHGKGYRVLAYRKDKYVDVYDEKTIKFISDERFDVTQKGCRIHVQTEIDNILCNQQAGKVHISFTFVDCDQRKIEVDIKEQTNKKSVPMNLLAPVGIGSEKPSYLPAFFLYDFDFVRKGNTVTKVLIGGKRIKLDPAPFPIPINWQWRYYTRYSMDCQLIEFLSSDITRVREVELNKDLKYCEGAAEYQYLEYNGCMGVSTICFKNAAHPLQIEFDPPLTLETHKGVFHILPESRMGSIDGSYQVTAEGEQVRIEVVADQGWRPVPNSFITKLIFGRKSLFCNWSKHYLYEQNINTSTLSSYAKWKNENKYN